MFNSNLMSIPSEIKNQIWRVVKNLKNYTTYNTYMETSRHSFDQIQEPTGQRYQNKMCSIGLSGDKWCGKRAASMLVLLNQDNREPTLTVHYIGSWCPTEKPQM